MLESLHAFIQKGNKEENPYHHRGHLQKTDLYALRHQLGVADNKANSCYEKQADDNGSKRYSGLCPRFLRQENGT